MPARKAVVPARAALRREELEALWWAHAQLEEASFAARLTNVIGTPIEEGLRLLPRAWHRRVQAAAEASIGQALDIAVASLPAASSPAVHHLQHKLAVAGAGAVGGFFGPLALLAELPVTTLIMLRSIAEIARSEGEQLDAAEGRRACIEVFALGGRSHADDAADAGYYGLRLALAMHFIGGVERAGGAASIPLGMQAVRGIAARFGLVVSDKIALQIVPVFGAATGALVNVTFMQHFQDVARGHFTVRRLERRYGAQPVRAAYMRIARERVRRARAFSPLEGW